MNLEKSKYLFVINSANITKININDINTIKFYYNKNIFGFEINNDEIISKNIDYAYNEEYINCDLKIIINTDEYHITKINFKENNVTYSYKNEVNTIDKVEFYKLITNCYIKYMK